METVALLGVLIPVFVVLLISAVPIYFKLSERHRRRTDERRAAAQGPQPDLAAEVEAMRRQRTSA